MYIVEIYIIAFIFFNVPYMLEHQLELRSSTFFFMTNVERLEKKNSIDF